MAKKPDLTGLLQRTDKAPTAQADNSDLDAGIIRPLGVGITSGERDALGEIAAEYELSRNALLRFALRWFILEYRAGRVDIKSHIEQPPPANKKIRLP